MAETDAAKELIDSIVMWMMKYGVNAQEAKNALYVMTHDYTITERAGDLIPYEGNKNEILLRKFIISKTTSGLSERTLQLYYKELRRILAVIGKEVSRMTVDDIRYYIARRIQTVTKTTCNNERHYLSSFFAWLTAEEIIPKNIMLRVEAVKQPKKKKAALSDDEIELLRTNLRTWREKAIFETLLSTGCRVSELISIRLGDIGEDGTICILGKGSKYRNVYLNARAKISLQKYIEERSDSNPYLFPRAIENFAAGSHGRRKANFCEWYKYPELINAEQPSDKGTIEGILRSLGKRSGIANVHPHRMRRTCATMALRKGMTLELVSKMLGHENVGTTQIYLDLNEEELKQAHQKYVT